MKIKNLLCKISVQSMVLSSNVLCLCLYECFDEVMLLIKSNTFNRVTCMCFAYLIMCFSYIYIYIYKTNLSCAFFFVSSEGGKE